MILLATVSLLVVSCYRITLVIQDHEAVTGGTFSGKVVVKRSGTSSNGLVQHVYGLFGVCVPTGWQASSTLVMTQVPKAGTDVGDDAYKSIITRDMVYSKEYSDLLNRHYYKSGYTWVGFRTSTDFKSLFNTDQVTNEVDSIYVNFAFTTNDRTGDFVIDYVAGQIDFNDLSKLGEDGNTWNTQAATFTADNIGEVTAADTHVRVTRPDGTMDEGFNAEPTLDKDWNLVLMDGSTREGSGVYAYKDKRYDGLFTRNRGWNGGDGVLTVGLPNGDVFWTFNDSFYGVVGNNRARGSSSFPRNSVMLQRNENGFPGENTSDQVWLANYVNWTDASADRYFQCRTHLRHPLATLSAASIQKGDIDSDYLYWSGDGVVYDGKLQMLWFGVDNRNGGMKSISAAIATYSLDGTIPQGYYLSDIPDYLPKQGNYLYMENVEHGIDYHGTAYGSTLWEDADGHNYLYASGDNSTTLVARTATHDLHSAWQYYVKAADGSSWSWQDAFPDSLTRARSSIVSDGTGLMLPWVFKDSSDPTDEWYYLLSQQAIFSKTVYIFRARTPYGPFEEKSILCRMPSTLDKLGTQTFQHTYMVNIHPELSRQGEIVLTTNTDTSSFWDNFNADGSADFYRPYFYRVFGWKKLFADVTTGIKTVDAPAKVWTDDAYYSVEGIRTLHPHKGLYIHHGKKVIIK